MSRYDFGFLTVFWGDNDPQGRKKDPLRPPGGPVQPAARRVNNFCQGHDKNILGPDSESLGLYLIAC